MIMVKAKRLGYYDLKRYREGQEFAIKSEKDFSASWMERIDEEEEQPRPRSSVSSRKKIQVEEVI